MRYLAAYLLLQVGGNASPTAADVKKVLAAVGIESDNARLDSLISELSGKDVAALISEGYGKLASVPSGGAVSSGGGGASSGGGGGGAAAETKEEEKEEEKEESDDDMGFGLFD